MFSEPAFWLELVTGKAFFGIILLLAVGYLSILYDRRKFSGRNRFFVIYGFLAGTLVTFGFVSAVERYDNKRMDQIQDEVMRMLEDKKKREQEIDV